MLDFFVWNVARKIHASEGMETNLCLYAIFVFMVDIKTNFYEPNEQNMIRLHHALSVIMTSNDYTYRSTTGKQLANIYMQTNTLPWLIIFMQLDQ